jgi:hypothetical protein
MPAHIWSRLRSNAGGLLAEDAARRGLLWKVNMPDHHAVFLPFFKSFPAIFEKPSVALMARHFRL